MYLIFTRQRLLCSVLISVFTAMLVAAFISAASGIDGSSDKARRSYAYKLGCRVYEFCEREIALPLSISSKAYSDCEQLQRRADFSLVPYLGCEATLYTYAAEYPECVGRVKLNLIVYRGKIIGGDISEPELNGRKFPLVKNRN